MLAVDANGLPIVARPNSAIPHEVIFQLHALRNNQLLTLEDAVTFVRGNLVPEGYAPYPFRKDTPESLLDKLRSVVVTHQFRCDVQYWKDQGVDFSLYMYVPEVDPITGDFHHERADHNHLLKRIAKHTRDGNNSDLIYERFDEAMRNPMTGLTHAALAGSRKQSVPDAENCSLFMWPIFLKTITTLQKQNTLRQLHCGTKHLMGVASVNYKDAGKTIRCLITSLMSGFHAIRTIMICLQYVVYSTGGMQVKGESKSLKALHSSSTTRMWHRKS